MGLLHFAFVMFQLFRVRVRPDRGKTALACDPGPSQQVSATAHSTANDTVSPTTRANKEENTSM